MAAKRFWKNWRGRVHRGGKSTVTGQQRRIWLLIAKGLDLKEIAATLKLKEVTVSAHRVNLCKALGRVSANNVELTWMAIRRGYVS